MSVKALVKNYLQVDDCPVSLCLVNQKNHITHDFDLTEIEHYHDFMEIAFILKGEGNQVVKKNEYRVAAGDVFVLQGNQKHYFRDASKVEIVNVMVDEFKNFKIIPDSIRRPEGFNALFILEPRYRTRHHFKNKLQLMRSELAKIEIVLNGMFLELPDNKIYIDEIAQMANMSKRNFQRIFKCALRISKVSKNVRKLKCQAN